MNFSCRINFVMLALILLFPYTKKPVLAQTFTPTHVEWPKNYEAVGGLADSVVLNLELPRFTSNYANDPVFVFERLGAASGTASYSEAQTKSENRFDPLNLAIGTIVMSAIGFIIYRSSDSK